MDMKHNYIRVGNGIMAKRLQLLFMIMKVFYRCFLLKIIANSV